MTPDGPSLTLREVAEGAGVGADTLRRWCQDGLIPQYDGRWTPAAAAQARIVARLRERGHSLEAIREATDSGQLAFGYIEDLFPPTERAYTLEEAANDCGLEPALIERMYQTVGFPRRSTDEISDDDMRILRYLSAVLAAGFPLVALLQLLRVYGQALARVADAEVRLFHLYIHEPLMRDGVPGLEMAEQMEGLARDLLPLAGPIMEHVHQRFLGHFVEQDVVGHMEAGMEADELGLGRIRVAIAFADLAGYTRLTEEEGEEQAVDAVEQFIDGVEQTLPTEARVIKTIGDEVMIVGSDAATLTQWAVDFQALRSARPWPRIGIHFGETLYRDGDYFGREVNQAARVAARAAGSEVLVTRPVVEQAGPDLEFDPIGQVRLKGFTAATELFLARRNEEG
jgi:adenylate cyclase